MKAMKTTLLVNGITSGLAGIGLIAFADQIAGLFGTGSKAVFMEVGIFLFLFAAFVVLTALQRNIQSGRVKIITTLDIMWVAASLLLVVVAGGSFSVIGLVAVIAVAAWVGLMAWLQIGGLKSWSTR